jgi:hypothetical protein
LRRTPLCGGHPRNSPKEHKKKLLRNFSKHLPSPTAAFIPILRLLFRIPLVMVFAYAAVSAAQKPRHPFGAGAWFIRSMGNLFAP